MEVRPLTRRGEPCQYLREPGPYSMDRADEHAPELVQQLDQLGAMSSALKRALRQAGIDPRMARLVLCFYGRRLLRPREIAWRCNISRSTASRWLDAAEQQGLVDKYFEPMIDRRATEARLTKKGSSLRDDVHRLLAAQMPPDPRYGLAYGRRWFTEEYKVSVYG